MVKIKFTPLRPWSDFFPGAERFAFPDIYDLQKWNYRVTCNLLYYQTNYMLMAVIVFLTVGFMDPISMFTGAAVVVAVFLGAEWAAGNKAIIKNFRKENPILFVFFVLLASYLLIPLFGEVMVFLLAIKLPQFLIFTHASLRLRNMRNKLENKLERAGLKKSPMGILLEALGQEEEKLNKIQDFLDGKLKE